MDAEAAPTLQQQQPQQHSEGSDVLLALQQAYPPLAALLVAARSGGLAAVLACPFGGAVSALMAKPAGQQLLMRFAELASDEALLAAALQQQQEAVPPGLAASASAAAAGPAGTPGSPSLFAGSCAGAAALQQALQQLHTGIASSQVAAAAQLLGALCLAVELHHEAADVAAGVARQLQAQLQLAEAAAAAERQQRLAAAAAADEAQQALRAARERLESSTLCIICCEASRDTVLMPCMHFLYCARCIQQNAAAAAKAAPGGAGVLRCPVCRVPCSGQVVVHLTGEA